MPTTYDEVIKAAKVIQNAGVVDYPLGGTFKAGWNLGEEFVNMYLGYADTFFDGKAIFAGCFLSIKLKILKSSIVQNQR